MTGREQTTIHVKEAKFNPQQTAIYIYYIYVVCNGLCSVFAMPFSVHIYH